MRVFDRFCVAVATGLYLSYIPFWLTEKTGFARLKRWTGAGLVGTVIGWATLYLLPAGGAGFAAALAAGIAGACVAADRTDRFFNSHDDSRIIIDEIVGFWAAASPVPRETGPLLAAFILFRVLDAWKPPPIRHFERLPGGIGVVMDDVAAGFIAGALVRLAWPLLA